MNTSYFHISTIDSVAILVLNTIEEKVNTLNEAMMEEFTLFLDRFESNPDWKGAVLISGKEDNFIAGADIEMFNTRESANELEALSQAGHAIFNRIESLKKPMVVAVHGSCMGGGLELSMACHYRIASTHPSTRFALPEVKLGILPGTGGTQRLPRLIGIQKSLPIMLTGKNVFSRQAKRMGLVDELIHKDALQTAGIAAVHRLSKKSFKRTDKRSFAEKILEATPLGRAIIFSQARKQTAKQTRGNYPAPEGIIDAVEFGYKKGFYAGLKEESRLFGKLGASSESRALVQLFFGMNNAKKIPQPEHIQPTQVIGVLGAGLMGSGIADESINQGGYSVILKDRDLESAVRGEKNVWKELDKKANKRIITSFERDRLMSQLTSTESYASLAHADVVIEAVFEDLDLKHQVLKEVEDVVSDRCIFATNTSSIPITDIAKVSSRPEQVIGMHYFSPVQKMPLLELITTPETASWVTSTAFQIGVKQGKTVIVVNDGPGFYTTRILAPYMNEALLLLEEGASIEFLEGTMKDFGYPVGPMVLFDEVGMDVGAHVGDVMAPLFNARGGRSSKKASELVEAGFLGRKNGNGLYRYEKGKKKTVNQSIYAHFGSSSRSKPDPETAQLRMGLMMVNEAVYCLQEDVLLSPTDGDLGAILGLGFPPFTGGPFRYIDQKGADWVHDTLLRFSEQFGPRFKPAPLLADYARSGRSFHPDK
ncbi:MAG: 3-hydroxyacyl-CoA dehydrogenase NAD-binding domain-containing protein [Bacteroidota bacterium]